MRSRRTRSSSRWRGVGSCLSNRFRSRLRLDVGAIGTEHVSILVKDVHCGSRCIATPYGLVVERVETQAAALLIVARPDRSERRFRMLIATFCVKVLRRPLESAQYASESYRALLTARGLVGSMRAYPVKADTHYM